MRRQIEGATAPFFFCAELFIDMEPIIIDLSKGNTLDESWLKMFGVGISSILQAMFGGKKIPLTVKGSPSEIKSFAKVLGGEKRYMNTYRKYGLDNAQTYRSKFRLNKAVKEFERKTGLIYPLR